MPSSALISGNLWYGSSVSHSILYKNSAQLLEGREENVWRLFPYITPQYIAQLTESRCGWFVTGSGCINLIGVYGNIWFHWSVATVLIKSSTRWRPHSSEQPIVVCLFTEREILDVYYLLVNWKIHSELIIRAVTETEGGHIYWMVKCVSKSLFFLGWPGVGQIRAVLEFISCFLLISFSALTHNAFSSLMDKPLDCG